MLPELLRSLRESHYLYQHQVARYLSLDRSTYTYYESGKTVPPTAVLLDLSELYQVPFIVYAYSAIERSCSYLNDRLCLQKLMTLQAVVRTIRLMDDRTFRAQAIKSQILYSPSLKRLARVIFPAFPFTDAVSLPSTIHRLRKEKGYSQLDIAADLSLNRSSIAYREHGKMKYTMFDLYKLAKLLDIPFFSLIHECIGDSYCIYTPQNFDRHQSEQLITTAILFMSAEQFKSFRIRFCHFQEAGWKHYANEV